MLKNLLQAARREVRRQRAAGAAAAAAAAERALHTAQLPGRTVARSPEFVAEGAALGDLADVMVKPAPTLVALAGWRKLAGALVAVTEGNQVTVLYHAKLDDGARVRDMSYAIKGVHTGNSNAARKNSRLDRLCSTDSERRQRRLEQADVLRCRLPCAQTLVAAATVIRHVASGSADDGRLALLELQLASPLLGFE
ncbi:isocitrate dehydrogenase [Chlorella sorokiniana]|uniref:Isocitrate dehydrogenase n=1 Tax=Chlorella sorokiniana TaxID=3076 RepID=A0A2P6TII0_CHLSO|nr:isocitrate dehydrogenase [Chlorella sorokiniana]|eukprot:PRW34087.1 isocitrate dehydrogenase [Chlorella sorokiniana]